MLRSLRLSRWHTDSEVTHWFIGNESFATNWHNRQKYILILQYRQFRNSHTLRHIYQVQSHSNCRRKIFHVAGIQQCISCKIVRTDWNLDSKIWTQKIFTQIIYTGTVVNDFRWRIKIFQMQFNLKWIGNDWSNSYLYSLFKVP